jgi:AcrR family transcriptional regulator
VATRAGIGPGSFYQYFRDRAALIGALLDRQVADDRATLEAFLRMPEVPVEDLPELLVKGVLAVYGTRPRAMANMAVLLRELGRDNDVAALTEDFCAELAARLERAHPRSERAACLDAARTAVYALLGSVRQAGQDTPERLVGDEAFRSRLVALVRAALTLS